MRASLTGSPLTAVMTSPDLMPALHRRAIRLRLGDQRAVRRLQAEAVGDVGVDRLDLHADPSARHRALVLELADHDRLTVSAGIAKAMPTEPPDGEKIAVLTPMTLPSTSKVGPPELPLFTGASIWMKSS